MPPGNAGPPFGLPLRVVSFTVIVAPARATRGAFSAETLRLGRLLKAAVHALSASMSTMPSAQSGCPVQPPKTKFGSGVAVKVTTVPPSNDAAHVGPQSIAAGVLVTVPVPEPVFVTPRVRVGWTTVTVTVAPVDPQPAALATVNA